MAEREAHSLQKPFSGIYRNYTNRKPLQEFKTGDHKDVAILLTNINNH